MFLGTRVESGSDDPDNLSHLGHFFGGSHPQSKLSGCDPDSYMYHVFFRKQCRHLVSESTLGLINALKYHWCETSLFLSQIGLKHVVSKDFVFKKSACTGILYPTKNKEIYGIVPYQKFFMSCCISYFKKALTCGSRLGHVWVTSVGQMGQQM